MENKKTKIAIISIVSLILVTIGLTYAYWLVTKTQTNENVISSGCLDISLSNEENDITLTNQFPMSDEDGMRLVPYTFTVTNNCNTSVDYQVALEAIGEESASISSDALKVALNDKITLLSKSKVLVPTISEAYSSYRIALGTLEGADENNDKDSISYELRIWIDAEADIEEMNKTFKSKISVTVGQGISNPIKEGTLAYDIVYGYNDPEDIETLSGTQYSEVIDSETSLSDYMINLDSYYWGSDYIFDEASGQFFLSGEVVKETMANCAKGTTECGKYMIKKEEASSNSTTVGSELYYVPSLEGIETESYNNFQLSVIKHTASQMYVGDFSATKEGEAGLYKASDNSGDSYYYRGDVENNYIKFGKISETSKEGYSLSEYSYSGFQYYPDITTCSGSTCTSLAGEDMYWRIVRVNGNSTIRIIYAGTMINGEIKEVNRTESDLKYGSTDDYTQSFIKDKINDWYNNRLIQYSNYLSDETFCNETSVNTPVKQSYAYYRLSVGNNPTLTCDKNYELSVSNSRLTYPIGLLTADEAVMAGLNSTENGISYISSAGSFFTMTSGEYPNYATAIYTVGKKLSADSSTTTAYSYMAELRPVINLKADVKFEGNGTIDTPYKIITE